MEAWEFEGYWYVQSPDSLPLCMNSREAVEYLRRLEAVAEVAWALRANSRYDDPIYENNVEVDAEAWLTLGDTLDALDREEQ